MWTQRLLESWTKARWNGLLVLAVFVYSIGQLVGRGNQVLGSIGIVVGLVCLTLFAWLQQLVRRARKWRGQVSPNASSRPEISP